MSTEQQDDGKVEITINFTNLPNIVWGDTQVLAQPNELEKIMAKSLLAQRHGRIDREGTFTEACPTTAPIIDFQEGDNAADSVRDVMDRWLATLVGAAKANPPEMELSPEIVQQVLAETGVDLSQYVVTNIQCTADPHVFNITLR
jgi:hypothetical protein